MSYNYDDEILIGDDTILPEQFYLILRSAHRPPEHVMLAAILDDALRCYLLCNKTHNAFNRQGLENRKWRMQQEAHKWIFGEYEGVSYEVPSGRGYSFQYICDALNIDVDWIRKELRALGAEGPYGIPRRAPVSSGTRMKVRQPRDYHIEVRG